MADEGEERMALHSQISDRARREKRLAVLLGFVFVLPVTVAIVLFVRSWFPEELAPSRIEHPDGTVEFVLQSRRDAASWPAGAAALVACCVAMSCYLRIRRGGPWVEARSHFVWRVVRGVLYVLLGFVFLKVILLDPLLFYRSIRFDAREVTMDCLYCRTSMPIADFREGWVSCREVEQKKCAYVMYEFRDARGVSHRSVEIVCPHSGGKAAEYLLLLGSIDAEIQRRQPR
jgi:hypothetical protein